MATKNPTAQKALTGAQPHRLLSVEERAVCDQVAAGDSLDGRRARALLAIDGGATQVEAGRQAGLTPGQGQYCLRKFRQQGLAIFPDAAPKPVPEPVSEPDPTPSSEPEPVASDGGAEMMVEKPRGKAGHKTDKGKKATRKKKKSGKKKKDGKKGQKSKSANSSQKKKRKSKSGKSSRKKGKSKSDKRGNKKRKKKSKG